MSGLIVLLHGLSGNRHTWGGVPDSISQSSSSGFFDVECLEYDAKFISSTSIETSARQILTKIETSHSNYEEIYLVGYSLGGLVAREVVRILLTEEKRDLLNRIPAIITIGTPLAGARFGNRILRMIGRISSKCAEIGQSELVFARYRDAIRSANKVSLARPKIIHFQIENDRVIKAHNKDKYTADDTDGGVIPGVHRNFADSNSSASYIADVILSQIHKARSVRAAPYAAPIASFSDKDLPDRLILIACSHNKDPKGTAGLTAANPVSWVRQPNLRQSIISKRSYVFSALVDTKLADGFERGGNRAHQPANAGIFHGIDFGGTAGDRGTGAYTPAYKRYSGRFYHQISGTAWTHYFSERDKVRVLIMSGLYGLIEPEEAVQNYDVHLSDTHTDSGQSVKNMWLDLFTDAISTYVSNSYKGRKVHIFNLLCDHHYVDSINWHSLPEFCSVFHLSSPELKDVDLLPAAGVIFDAFLKNPDRLETIERDTRRYPLTDFGVAPPSLSNVEILFESKIGLTRNR